MAKESKWEQVGSPLRERVSYERKGDTVTTTRSFFERNKETGEVRERTEDNSAHDPLPPPLLPWNAR